MQLKLAYQLASKFLPNYSDLINERVDLLPRDNINEYGVDPFGYDPKIIKNIAPLAIWLYKNYFRVEASGIENVPAGRFLVIANHSGQIPVDGMMIETAFLLEAEPPRLLRGMAEKWSAGLPFISTLFTRGGQVVGIPNACKKLLEMNEAVIVFPEGVRGINKLWKNRYKLAKFGSGFMRLAMQTNTPILPVSVIGAEEQAPAIANLKGLAKVISAPNLPVIFPQLIPFPMPTKYKIQIGKPMHFKSSHWEDESKVAKAAARVQCRIQSMLHEGLSKRQSIFFG